MSHRRELLALCGELQTALPDCLGVPTYGSTFCSPSHCQGQRTQAEHSDAAWFSQHWQVNPASTTTTTTLLSSMHWDGHFTMSILTVPSFLPTSLASLLFAVTTLSMTLIKQQFWPLPLAQKSPLLSLCPQASQSQAFQKCKTLASLH